jgi:hypothetical protein
MQLKIIIIITEILTRNELQDILQCNRYIHLVKATQSLTNIYAYLTELHVLKTMPKDTYAKTGLIKAILRVIHNLELDLPQDGTNKLVIKTVFII